MKPGRVQPGPLAAATGENSNLDRTLPDSPPAVNTTAESNRLDSELVGLTRLGQLLPKLVTHQDWHRSWHVSPQAA